MPLLSKTPLAWKNLTHDWRRLAVAVAGIGFAVLLMFTQVGFQNALFDSQVKMIDDLQGDIFLVSRAKYTLAAEKRFPLELINQASSARGVRGAYPLYTELTFSRLKNLKAGASSKAYPIRSIGFRLSDPVIRSPEVNAQLTRLQLPNAALIDVRSKRDNFDFPFDDAAALAAAPAELANKRVTLVGTFELGTDFAHDGNLAMSSENFARYFPQRVRVGDPLSVVDLGIVHVQEGAEVEEVRDRIDALLDDRVFVFTRSQFRRQEVKFWDESTPIGIIFTAGKIIGFVVGMVICYQVIYSDISDHMPEFATLKAMGYTTGYFLRLIVVEAVLLSLIGFVPGLIASTLLYSVLAEATGLQLQMTVDSIVLVLILTNAMCIASGMLAVRKLLAADPANLF
ncbi:MAG: FtsX-like permease family protein [Pirellulales bacterium]|nr:FtsX-like permease family protein [Pirellulales bacterium]